MRYCRRLIDTVKKRHTQSRIRMIKIGGHLEVSPLFLLLAAASVWGKYTDMFLIAYFSAILHECAHMAAAAALKIKTNKLCILPFGVCGKLETDFIKDPYKEMIVAAAGPLMSGLLALSLCASVSAVPPAYYGTALYSVRINLALMLLNLVPALPLDGGRILKSIISIKCGGVRAWNLMIKFSRFPIAAILASAVVLLLTSSFNFSLIMIGVFLLGNLTIEQKNVSLASLREILYYKNNLGRSAFCPVTRLAARPDVSARLLLRRLGCYKYHIIDVVDDDGRIIKTLTESQIISALLQGSIRLTLGEI